MKLLVFGDGLLGSVFKDAAIVVSKSECDIIDATQVSNTLLRYAPDIAINCAGIVPKNVVDIIEMFYVNALGPRILANHCEMLGIKLIHISTNCVFSNSAGYNTEQRLPTPVGVYGISKLLGETKEKPHLTIRTSFVGLPDPKGRGLLHWASETDHIIGYDREMWNGVTTLELKRIILEELIPSNFTGLIHVAGETVSKYDLLVMANRIFKWNKTITRQSDIVDSPETYEKTLGSIYKLERDISSLEEQLEELYVGISSKK